MGRRTFKIEKHEVVVGWDPPLSTFFGQIYMLEREHEPGCQSKTEFVTEGHQEDCVCDNAPVLWVGASGPRIMTPDHLEDVLNDRALSEGLARGDLGPWFEIPESLKMELAGDQLHNR